MRATLLAACLGQSSSCVGVFRGVWKRSRICKRTVSEQKKNDMFNPRLNFRFDGGGGGAVHRVASSVFAISLTHSTNFAPGFGISSSQTISVLVSMLGSFWERVAGEVSLSPW